MSEYKKNPYGISSYKRIKRENYFYVDKTRFIPKIEASGSFLFLIRPRRFGKSSLLSVLESYYDIARKADFDFLFENTYIKEHPTPEKNSHLILKFNFSRVNPDLDKIEESFSEYIDDCIFFFGEKYREFLDDVYFKMMERKRSPHGKLGFLLNYLGSKDLKAYILIDEYDNFTNTILSTVGQEKYHKMTHGAGFFRFFFNVLKGAADEVDTGVGRMFITGVSPVTMDDVTSGFNIGVNISLSPVFNELLGFSERDVVEIMEYYRDNGMPLPNPDETLNLLREWYDNYRFSSKSETRVFNTDMILYFINNLMDIGEYPEDMIDPNVKIDYEKLRHLVTLDKRLNGNFSRLSEIIENCGVSSIIKKSFPVEKLTDPANFISLLYYFGLLSYSKTDKLNIPNLTVKKLMYGYIREGYEDVDVFSVDPWRFANLIHGMAFKGEWAPVFRLLADEVEKQTSIRDYLTGEKVIQTFLLAYLNMTDYYITRTEEEMGKGFADLYLEPFTPKYPDIAHGYLIELKYMKRGEFSDEKLKKLLLEAKDQLKKYAGDEHVKKRLKGSTLKCLSLVFHGWELKAAEEFGPLPLE